MLALKLLLASTAAELPVGGTGMVGGGGGGGGVALLVAGIEGGYFLHFLRM